MSKCVLFQTVDIPINVLAKTKYDYWLGPYSWAPRICNRHTVTDNPVSIDASAWYIREVTPRLWSEQFNVCDK